MIVIVSLVFAHSLVTVYKLDLGHVAIVYSLNLFNSPAAPAAAYLAIAIVWMFSSLDFRSSSQILMLITETKKTTEFNLGREYGRKVKMDIVSLMLLFTDAVY